jgi:uncharacterized protein DUF6879
MELITSTQRDELFCTLQRDAFHLELRDSYGNPLEDEPLVKWRAGVLDDRQYLRPWLAMVRAVTGSGKVIRRLRVITEPVTEYVRFEWEITPDNLAAGEEIRWLPRHLLPAGIEFPCRGLDWWLFDDQLAAFGHFHEDGRVKGSEIVTDPVVVGQCVRVRDQLWPLAIPHSDYKLA